MAQLELFLGGVVSGIIFSHTGCVGFLSGVAVGTLYVARFFTLESLNIMSDALPRYMSTMHTTISNKAGTSNPPVPTDTEGVT